MLQQRLLPKLKKDLNPTARVAREARKRKGGKKKAKLKAARSRKRQPRKRKKATARVATGPATLGSVHRSSGLGEPEAAPSLDGVLRSSGLGEYGPLFAQEEAHLQDLFDALDAGDLMGLLTEVGLKAGPRARLRRELAKYRPRPSP